MQIELWKQVEDLFHRARAMTPDKRVAFLQCACGGDLLLQREVETLLDHFDAASSFLETSPLAQMIGSLAPRPQALAAGRMVGSFEIVHLIGRGGMGEVYRATDNRLKRDVALKVLPTYLSTDARALCRFELEAQAAGRLNHSNIVAVYDIGVHEGAPYLVSELLEGESLRSRLAKRSPAAEDGH
jgi:serine/threonine protein kinase